MTIVESMENVAAYLKEVVTEYSAKQASGRKKIEVYAGFPPVRTSRDETPSCVYCVPTEANDGADGASNVKLMIGLSVYDADKDSGGRSLYNLAEHIRQALLKKRTLGGRNRLILPLKTEIPTEQPFPEWVGVITATYTIAFIEEEGIDYGETFDRI